MPGVPCCPMHEQKTKVTCIGQFVKLCCESNADGLRPVCLSLVCTKGQGLARRLCPEYPRFLTCAWGLHTVRTSCDVTHVRSATIMCGSSGQSYLVLPRHGFLFAILRHGLAHCKRNKSQLTPALVCRGMACMMLKS